MQATYFKIKRMKKERKKKVKEKYYSSTIIRENADISYKNIELLKQIEKNKSALIYPSCINMINKYVFYFDK